MSSQSPNPSGLFVGLCTLDVIQLVDHVPAPNEKLTAQRMAVAAGGPATNAAVTYAYLGGRATLITGVGAHALTAGIRADIKDMNVNLIDFDPEAAGPPPISTILVTAASGDRAVVSVNAAGRQLRPGARLASLAEESRIVLVDGHHPELSHSALSAARKWARTTLLDGGSWKSGLEALLPLVDVALCSADFHPPGTATPLETFDFLRARGVVWAAITRGPDPILWSGPNGEGQVAVPHASVMDTLGAGDAFHGAFAFAVALIDALDEVAFVNALRQAAVVAATSCESFGTRAWMSKARPRLAM
jgi:sugar/nucleoside kinase (ribokinase family)